MDDTIINWMERRKQMYDFNVKLEDLVIITILGEGGFGKVMLVQNIKNQELYALKVIVKEALSTNKNKDLIKNEITLIKQCDHPNVMILFKEYQDEKFIYLVCEYVSDKTVLFLFKEKPEIFKDLTNNSFYTTQIVLTLYYLHKRKVIHRDIKPANLVLSANG